MKAKHSDLIAIANASLAKKLDNAAEKEERAKLEKEETKDKESSKQQHEFKQDVWRAVYTLNIMRYVLAFSLLIVATLLTLKPDFKPIINLLSPWLFAFSAIMILISSIVFSYISSKRLLPFTDMILVQFSLDVILVTALIHSVGSINSVFSLLFFMVVATGSIVLPRIQALGLAAGTIILMLYEHTYSILRGIDGIMANFELLVGYALLLFVIAWTISYMAERLRVTELKTFVPGNETIEEFLVREEIKALQAALNSTNGNKTQAAKLLGMTFRSFRYKLGKYDID